MRPEAIDRVRQRCWVSACARFATRSVVMGCHRKRAMPMINDASLDRLARFLDLNVLRGELVMSNMANIDTPGYKDTRVLFSDLFYQDLGTTGSGDPIQLGAGTQVGSLPSMFTQGSVTSTGVPTDVAIQGNGFFVVQRGNVVSYTRAGNFSVDKDNFLVTADGQQVLGYPAANGVVNTGQALSPLQLGAGTISPPTTTTSVQIQTNLNAAATVGGTDGVY